MAFRSILFPYDFSSAAVAMVPSVAAFARQFGATVTVLHAFHLAPEYVLAPRFDATFGSEPPAIPYLPQMQEARNQREHRLAEFAKSQFAGIEVKARIEDGDPAATIAWVAKHEDSDLIMMSTKGHGKFRQMLLGSVTAKVLHDVECPVFTNAHAAEERAHSQSSFRSVLCAVRSGPESKAAMQAAIVIAQTWGARLCLLHLDSSHDSQERIDSIEAIRQSLKRLAENERGPRVTLRTRVLDAAIPEGISQAATEEAADLVIVGRGHIRDGVSRLWSHVYAILCQSPCPVLSV